MVFSCLFHQISQDSPRIPRFSPRIWEHFLYIKNQKKTTARHPPVTRKKKKRTHAVPQDVIEVQESSKDQVIQVVEKLKQLIVQFKNLPRPLVVDKMI